jgi:LCP family protein required for cell wall assembly
MSDGGNATPGRRRPGPPGDDDNQWVTRTQRPIPGAAPWERHPETNGSAGPPQAPRSHFEEPARSHSEEISVAELIAKVTGETVPRHGEEPTHHRLPVAAPPAAPPVAAQPVAPPVAVPPVVVQPPVRQRPAPEPYVYEPSTEIIPALPSHASEVPNLPNLAELAERPKRARPERLGDADPHETRRQTHRARKTAMVFGRVVAALIAVLALALTGAAWQWQAGKNRSLNKVAALDPNSRDILDPNAQFGDENFLIVGVDSRIGQNSDMGAGTTDDAAGARSDTIMLVNIPASRKRVVAVSFPRDLAIKQLECEPWNPETGKYGALQDENGNSLGDEAYTTTKLNSTYAVGGPKCLVKEIQKLSGLSINRFMAVDFSGFSKMVDALGGVEVCSTTPLQDYELGTVLADAGRQTIDGHTALQYVRARQVTTETNGDYGRIKRQQLFLSSLLRSLISKEVFFSLSKLNNVVNLFIDDTYVDNIQTKDLVDLGQSIQGVSAGRVTFVTVPTGITDTEGNEPPRVDDMRSLFDAIINDDPLPQEKNADNTPVPGTTPSPAAATADPAPAGDSGADLVDAVTTNPSDITVKVSNSTGEDGLASTAATELKQHGFVVSTPDDYPATMPSTTVFFSAGNEQSAATVASAFVHPSIERVSGMGDVVQVVLGSDFKSVGTPSPSGSPVQVRVLHGTSTAPTKLPEDLTVTNAADTTCE